MLNYTQSLTYAVRTTLLEASPAAYLGFERGTTAAWQGQTPHTQTQGKGPDGWG